MEFEKLQLEVVEEERPAFLVAMVLQSELIQRIRDAQKKDPECEKLRE